MRVGRVKYHRAARQQSPQPFEIADRFNGRQVGIVNTQVDARAGEAQFFLAETVVLDEAIARRIKRHADGRGQVVVWGDNEKVGHACAMFSRCPADGGEVDGPWFKRLGKSTCTVVPFFSLLEMLRLPP